MIGEFRGPPRPVRRVARDSVRIALADGQALEVERVRDPRARRMRLTVSPKGARLTLPLRASDAAGERFVRQHGDWLLAQLARRDTEVTPLEPHVTTHVPLRGAWVPVQWHDARYLRMRLDADVLDVSAPATATPAALARALRDMYEAQARADVGRWLPPYLAGLPRAPSRLRFRMMASLWGSLTRDGAMSLDLSLVLARPAAFEYVLVHELCHLIHMDHSAAFWHEVQTRCPQWRVHRAYFREDGRALKAALRALCGPGG